jgi:hypothetical protein
VFQFFNCVLYTDWNQYDPLLSMYNMISDQSERRKMTSKMGKENYTANEVQDIVEEFRQRLESSERRERDFQQSTVNELRILRYATSI